MKRLILLALILISIPVIVISGSSKSQNRLNYYPDLPKDDKWEFVKERVFDGETENVHGYSGPILVEIVNGHSADSTALGSVFEELRALLPHKDIDYFRNYTGTTALRVAQSDDPKEVNGFKFSSLKGRSITLWITEVDSKKEAYKLYDERFLKAVTPNGRYYGTYSINNQKRISGYSHLQFTLKFHESQSAKERMEIMRFYLVRMISCSSLFKERINDKFDVERSMLNSHEPSSTHLKFTEYDKFLLQKLYSPTLIQEYRDYMYSTYPWRFAGSFINKEKIRIVANWLRSILAVLLVFLSFSVLYKRHYRIKYMSYFVPILITLICFLNINYLYSYLITTGNHFNLERYTISFLTYFSIAVLEAFFLWVFDKYIIKRKMSFATQLVLKTSFTFFVFLSLAILPLIYSIYINKIHVIDIDWNRGFDSFLAFNSPVTLAFLFSLGRGVILYLDHFSENLIKQKDIELSNLKAINAQAEVKLLQSQINPHFLYNALNSIASLAQTDASKTENMALSLSDLFKYTINRKGKKKNAIRDEVEMVKTYLEVEQIRFGDRLSYKVHVDESLNDIEIPMFLIQPLIENAVKHGVSKIEGAGEVQLNITKNNEGLVIMVTDNGPQFPDGLVSGHGLQTVYDLLKFSYADNASISIENEPVKQITITIKT